MTEVRKPLSDPMAMRALAHPARLAILNRLNEQIDELLAPYRITTRERIEAPIGARIAEAQVSLFPRVERRPHGLPGKG